VLSAEFFFFGMY